MIIGLTGAAGSGKASVADVLVAEHGFQRIAFADCLYEEVSAAFNVPIEFLKNRDTKESPTPRLALGCCADEEFCRVVMRLCGVSRWAAIMWGWKSMWRWRSWSPCQILQWWGTKYRRAQCKTYLVDKVRDRLALATDTDWAIVGVRAQDEADLVQELGGQLGLVLRPGVEPVAHHVSEEFWQTCSPDIVIKNDGTLEGLQSTVNVIVTAIMVVLDIQEASKVAEASWTVADTILARKILRNLGYATEPSMEPGADERVDRIAKMLADHRTHNHGKQGG